MADQHAEARVCTPKRSHRRTALGLVFVALPGLGGLTWFAIDQYLAERGKFAAYPLLVAGAGLVAGVWIIFGERAKTAGVVCVAFLATIAAVYPTIIHPPGDPSVPRDEVAPQTRRPSSTRAPTTTSLTAEVGIGMSWIGWDGLDLCARAESVAYVYGIVMGTCDKTEPALWQVLPADRSETVRLVARDDHCLALRLDPRTEELTDPSGNSIFVVLEPCHPGEIRQVWSRDGEQFKTESTYEGEGYCLDIEGVELVADTYLLAYRCDGTPEQRWEITPVN